MKRLFVALCFLVLVIALVPMPGISQSSQTEMKAEHAPPPIILLGREEVKPGKFAAHEKLEAAWTQAYAKANWPNYTLALSSVTGSPEVWFCNGFSNYEAMQKDGEMARANAALMAETDRYAAQEDQFLSGMRRVILSYREDLSYQPNVNVGGFHDWMVDVIRVRVGHGPHFAEMRKLINAAHEKAKMDEHMVVYQVAAGGPMGTFVVFQPIPDIKSIDTMAKTHGNGSDYYSALGDEGRKQIADFMMNEVQNYERHIFATSASMSYMPKEVVTADPAFWSPKPMKSAKPTEAKATKAKQP
ncbi:MAG: hypothetical protein ROO76_00500 [Terriglobia bacterium]|jgi:hypothetical protein|nr:hypothetical protein [Terriglobia bacterium]